MTKQKMLAAAKRLAAKRAPKAVKSDALNPAEVAAYEQAVRCDSSKWETAILLLEKAIAHAISFRMSVVPCNDYESSDAARTFLAGRLAATQDGPYKAARRCLELAHRDHAKKKARRG